MISRAVWRWTGTKTWRAASLVLLAASLAATASLVWLMLESHSRRHPGRPAESAFLSKAPDEAVMSIPVRYLPLLVADKDEHGARKIRTTYGQTTIEVPTSQVALVMVDTWNSGDPPEGEAPSGMMANIQQFLKRCRARGATIIHAPNYPVVEKYLQHRRLRDEVRSFLGYDTAYHRYASGLRRRVGDFARDEIYRWPPSDLYQKYGRVRTKGRALAYIEMPAAERYISRLLTPRPDEFVVVTSDEFRYVLWLRQIKVLLYVGGATNECMLHRDTGINQLAGRDASRTNYIIVVLGDCSSTMPSPWSQDGTAERVMLDYMMNKIAFVGTSTDVFWKTPDQPSHGNDPDAP